MSGDISIPTFHQVVILEVDFDNTIPMGCTIPGVPRLELSFAHRCRLMPSFGDFDGIMIHPPAEKPGATISGSRMRVGVDIEFAPDPDGPLEL